MMNNTSIYERMAKEGRLNISDSITSFISAPITKRTIQNTSVHSETIDFTVITPEKINYKFDLRGVDDHSPDSLSFFLRKINHQKEREMLLLEKAGIPVFINDNTEAKIEHDDFGSRIVASYQIPEALMYKSFYVRYGITEGARAAGEYAMQKVMEVINKY